jgi:peroxiredoxin Q/BCP
VTLRDIVKLVLGRGRGTMLHVGDTAPDFEVLDHAGTRRTLSDYKGKTVVLWFYPKADTPG